MCVCVQLGDTPLHFACKFGFVEMVAILISHPGTDKQQKNRDGLTPKDVCFLLYLLIGFVELFMQTSEML